MFVISNSAGSSDDPDAIPRVQQALGCKVLPHQRKKPAVCGLMSIADDLQCGPEILQQICEPAGAVAVVGDRVRGCVCTAPSPLLADSSCWSPLTSTQLMTDVLMANLHGMLAIHTRAFTSRGDTPPAVVVSSALPW